jgi:hypothetical protein
VALDAGNVQFRAMQVGLPRLMVRLHDMARSAEIGLAGLVFSHTDKRGAQHEQRCDGNQ